jgi:hypothetical protein
MPTTIPTLANAELVTLAAIRSVVSAYGVGAGTTLQGPDRSTGVLSWDGTGFVTAATVGGSINGTVPMRRPVMSIDVYATDVGKERPPWGRAIGIVETIIAACQQYALKQAQLVVSLPTGYPSCRVAEMTAITEPERRTGDEANYAHYGFEMAVSWHPL